MTVCTRCNEELKEWYHAIFDMSLCPKCYKSFEQWLLQDE
jgi:protein-arginine kinase activator protein McsA